MLPPFSGIFTKSHGPAFCLYCNFHSYSSPWDPCFKVHFVGVAFKRRCLYKIGVSYSGCQAPLASLFRGNSGMDYLCSCWKCGLGGPPLDIPWLKRAAAPRSLPGSPPSSSTQWLIDKGSQGPVLSLHQADSEKASMSRAPCGVGPGLCWDSASLGPVLLPSLLFTERC